ncbi:MAG: Npt1/Npt2 family nucleotide transporter [Myxococcota bacterium]
MCIIASYGFARPVTDSLFLKHHGAQNLPLVYLLSPFVTALAIGFYNHFNVKYSLLRLLGCAAIISILVMLICLWMYELRLPGSVYMLYVWREVYMVLLVEIFWSLADTLFNLKSARRSYGLVLAIGSIGGFSNLMVGVLADHFGTSMALLGVVPCLGTCALLTWVFSKNLLVKPVVVDAQKRAVGLKALSVVKNSHYLLPLLFLIAIVQISVSLIDLQWNTFLEATYTDTDVRTGIIGKIHTVDNVLAAFLQFFAGYIIKLLGMGGVFVGIPVFLSVFVCSFIGSPRFMGAAILKISSKMFDYSLFRASKEMLYIPLSHAEKTQGKALIDILVYRIAKSSAALLMIFMLTFGLAAYSMHLVLALMVGWILLAGLIVKRYKSVVSLYNEEA